MKTILTLAIVVLSVLGMKAQPVLYLTNATNCNLLVVTFGVTVGTCTSTMTQNTVMPAGTFTFINAPAGFEWYAARVLSNPFCPGGVAFAIGTPMNCASTCSMGLPNNVFTPNSGCNGCLPTVGAHWTDCNGPNAGILRIWDF